MKLLFTITFISCSSYLFGQLDKNIWLVGGNARLYSYNITYDNGSSGITKSKNSEINLSASIGYFVIEKFAVGLKPTFSSIKSKAVVGSGMENAQRYWIGPYGRYYILNKEKQYNLVLETSYQFGFGGGSKSDYKLKTISAAGGPVIFFNSSVGIEFLFGYYYQYDGLKNASSVTAKGFQTTIGFQIHLEK